MWPFSKRAPSAFEAEMNAVRALPDPDRAQVRNWFDPPQYGQQDPILVPPLLAPNRQAQFAEQPIIDRYPTIIGQSLSGQYVSTAFRLANSGWRYQLVDLLSELLENDPDTRAVARARILGIACGRYTVEPARLGDSATDAERDLTKRVADEFALEFDNIPYRTQRIQQLAWADWDGVAGHEIMWEHPTKSVWDISDLRFIHTRRLNYTNPVTWDLYVYDQGLVGPGSDYMGPTVGVYGLPVAKYPGKFLIHTPSLSKEYPTRDGEGRFVAFYMLLKRMVTRCSAQDFERVIRPWVLGYFNRTLQPGHETPIADKKDIELLNAALAAFGSGSMNSAALPNTVRVELLRAAAAMTAMEFLSYLNRSIAKGLLGQAFTTEPGPNGNLATATTADANTDKVLSYSAGAMSDTLRFGLALPWTQLNHPALPRSYAPRIVADISAIPKPQELITMAKDMTSMDAPVDIDDLESKTPLKLLAKDDTTGRRTRMLTAKDGPRPADPTEAPLVEDDALSGKSAKAEAQPILQVVGTQSSKQRKPLPQ